MKLLKFLICYFLVFSINTLFAQTNILITKKVENIGKKTTNQIKVDSLDLPLAYGYTSNDDVLWSKVVWEIIDLNQKINHPFYYPTDLNSVGTDRLSLYNTLHESVKRGELKIYEDSYFTKPTSYEKVYKQKLFAECNNNETIEILSEKITKFEIKGMWYFDKRQGELKYRLLAIAPLVEFWASTECARDEARTDAENENDSEEDFVYVYPEATELISLYWIFFPEARKILYDSKVFNSENSVSPISFDHLLNARRFSSVIVREENVYQNRSISDYIKTSLFQLLEANKIKEDIRNKEMDMWNY